MSIKNYIQLTFIALVILTTFVMIACDEDYSNNTQYTTYLYNAYDSTGTKVVKGWFTLKFQDSTTVEGNWEFKKNGAPQNVGPQVGEGTLTGNIEQDNRIVIDLNPQWKDNNVILDGVYSKEEFNGTWTWVSFIGVTSSGSFEAFQ